MHKQEMQEAGQAGYEILSQQPDEGWAVFMVQGVYPAGCEEKIKFKR